MISCSRAAVANARKVMAVRSSRARAKSAPAPLWLLPALLRRRSLSAPQFAAMLRSEGYRISDSQVYRLLQREPQRFDRALLIAICRTLGCTITDLLEYDPRTHAAPLLPPAFRVPGT